MILSSNIIIYPEGDTREIDHTLQINQIVDINGFPLRVPLPTNRMIAFRVYKISRTETRNETIKNFHLEALSAAELLEYT